ncbi:hypothetical protein F2Q70_00043017 [Brassica cretica]|uniref:F-box/LRR-repeat protein 15-like leucin rich repeat domain-containing protein n=1 Tax=Brassica cretica TaxID=69181 RepID=A0A8S9KML5_BRACR|nr:hypothetical protein F2Q70_00043017 [Brassica cretica]
MSDYGDGNFMDMVSSHWAPPPSTSLSDNGLNPISDIFLQTNQSKQRSGLVDRVAARIGRNIPPIRTDNLSPFAVSKNPKTVPFGIEISPGLSSSVMLQSPSQASFPSPKRTVYPLHLLYAVSMSDYGDGNFMDMVSSNWAPPPSTSLSDNGLNPISDIFPQTNQSKQRPGLVDRVAARIGRNIPPIRIDNLSPFAVSKNPKTVPFGIEISPGLSSSVMLQSPSHLINPYSFPNDEPPETVENSGDDHAKTMIFNNDVPYQPMHFDLPPQEGSCKSISDSCLNIVSALRKLTSLNLAGADVTDSGMVALGKSDVPIMQLSFRGCKRVSDRGISHLLSNEGTISRTLSTLDLGHMPGISDRAIHTITRYCKALTELSLRSCFHVTDSSIELLATRERQTEGGSKQLRKLNVHNCVSLTTGALRWLSKPSFAGLHWLGLGQTRFAGRRETVTATICEQRPWLTLCFDGCELGCYDGWEFHTPQRH